MIRIIEVICDYRRDKIFIDVQIVEVLIFSESA